MGRKNQIDNEVKEKIIALLATGKSKQAVARELNVSWATVDKYSKKEPDRLEDLREQKKEEFINNAWEVIAMATEQVKKTIGKAGPGEAAKVAGIFYDKQALANGDPTNNLGGGLTVTLEGELGEWSK